MDEFRGKGFQLCCKEQAVKEEVMVRTKECVWNQECGERGGGNEGGDRRGWVC